MRYKCTEDRQYYESFESEYDTNISQTLKSRSGIVYPSSDLLLFSESFGLVYITFLIHVLYLPTFDVIKRRFFMACVCVKYIRTLLN